MNLKKTVNKKHLLQYKENVIAELDEMLLSDINSGNMGSYKKAANIVYWVNDFIKYTKGKDDFSAKNFIPFKRGQVVKVNLGFNVGREEGGLHYAVVIDKKNSERSDLLTIVPLTSIKFDSRGNVVNLNKRFDVLLGTDLAMSILQKGKEQLNGLVTAEENYIRLNKEIRAEMAELFHIRSKKYLIKTNKFTYKGVIGNFETGEIVRSKMIKAFSNHFERMDETISKKGEEMVELKDKLEEIKKKRHVLDKVLKEVNKMKGGSIALVGQITTISKQRLFDPKYEDCVLSGIRISSTHMEVINNKIKELYIF